MHIYISSIMLARTSKKRNRLYFRQINNKIQKQLLRLWTMFLKNHYSIWSINLSITLLDLWLKALSRLKI